MAVAVRPTAEPKTPTQPLGLVAASAVGAVFVLVAAALVLRGLPALWEAGVYRAVADATNSFIAAALLILAQVAAVVGLIVVGTRLGGGRHATGIRGGIFFMICVAFTLFFCGRAIYLITDRGMNFGNILLIALNVVLLGLVVQFFRTGRFVRWSVAIDEGGWLATNSYKRSQGQRVRRLTMLGILLVAGSGIWTLVQHDYLPKNQTVKLADGQERDNRYGDWVIGGDELKPKAVPSARATATDDERKAIEAERDKVRVENQGRPRVEGGFTLLSDLAFAVPLLLIGGALWVAWRAVNYPTFADFLIATEAEINKVSWSSRKALIRDTIVVLVCLLLLTLFLFVVDMFWNYVLSREVVNVLPTAQQQKDAAKDRQQDPDAGKDW